MKYMGSKFRIASHIAERINNIAICEGITEYYEPFMGGCSVGELVNIQNRHLSDTNKYVVELFKRAQKGIWEYKYVDREEYARVKANKDIPGVYPEWYIGWCAIACSFRGRPFEGFGGKYIDKLSGVERNAQLQVYNSLVKEVPLIENVDFKCQDYKSIGEPYHSIIYCDAPYRGTKQYSMVDKFDFNEYDDWLLRMSKNNLVLISEYSMVGQHSNEFIMLDHWQLNKSIGSGNTDDESSIEYMFYVKDGWLTDKYFEDTEDYEF